MAHLEDERKRHGLKILISSGEISRGLFGPPAFLQNNIVFIRKEALKDWLWAKWDEWSYSKRDNTMKKAFSYYDFDRFPEKALEEIVECELETLIHHEVGEALLNKELGEKWKEMVIDFAYTRTEIVVRAVKDIAADCMVTLPSLINDNRESSLHLYFANYSDMRKELYPELFVAYREWDRTADYISLLQLVEKAKISWFDMCKKILKMYQSSGKSADKQIIEMLGIEDYTLKTGNK